MVEAILKDPFKVYISTLILIATFHEEVAIYL
jgi:hypothetical protein